jgi:hypothetical protein
MRPGRYLVAARPKQWTPLESRVGPCPPRRRVLLILLAAIAAFLVLGGLATLLIQPG